MIDDLSLTSTLIADQAKIILWNQEASTQICLSQSSVNIATMYRKQQSPRIQKWSSKSPEGQFLRKLVENGETDDIGAAKLKDDHTVFKKFDTATLNSALQTARKAVQRDRAAREAAFIGCK